MTESNHCNEPRQAGLIQDEILEILKEAKVLARRFYRLTGKPLGVTDEVAEYEAATKLGLLLHPARQAGYYSVPYYLVKHQLEGRLTAQTVECFHANQRVASHLRSPYKGRHTTQTGRMPKSHANTPNGHHNG